MSIEANLPMVIALGVVFIVILANFFPVRKPKNAMLNNNADAVAENKKNIEGNFGLLLLSAGDNKIAVLKLIREEAIEDLRQAKELIDAAPSVIGYFTEEKAAELKQKLEEIGASAEIQEKTN